MQVDACEKGRRAAEVGFRSLKLFQRGFRLPISTGEANPCLIGEDGARCVSIDRYLRPSGRPKSALATWKSPCLGNLRRTLAAWFPDRIKHPSHSAFGSASVRASIAIEVFRPDGKGYVLLCEAFDANPASIEIKSTGNPKPFLILDPSADLFGEAIVRFRSLVEGADISS